MKFIFSIILLSMIGCVHLNWTPARSMKFDPECLYVWGKLLPDKPIDCYCIKLVDGEDKYKRVHKIRCPNR